MKILFDTNIIISGFLAQGYSFEIIKDAIYKHTIYYTEYLLKEIRDVLSTKFPLRERTAALVFSTIKKHFVRAETAHYIEKICRDPDDDQFLADALANRIEIIVTGNKDLLNLASYKGIRIVSPKEYWSL